MKYFCKSLSFSLGFLFGVLVARHDALVRRIERLRSGPMYSMSGYLRFKSIYLVSYGALELIDVRKPGGEEDGEVKTFLIQDMRNDRWHPLPEQMITIHYTKEHSGRGIPVRLWWIGVVNQRLEEDQVLNEANKILGLG